MGPPQALIHWVNEERWDVWPATQVPAEIRFEGGVGLIKYTDGVSYLGKIIKITGIRKDMEQAESKLHSEIDKKKQEVPTKRKSSKAQPLGKQASNNDVRRAVGERTQLSTPQREAKKRTREASKSKTAAEQRVEKEEQSSLIKSVSRKLFAGKNSAHDALSDDDVGEDSNEDEEEVFGVDDVDNNAGELNQDDNESEKSEDEGEMDPNIRDFRNPNTERFLEYLLKCFRTKPGSNLSPSSSNKVYAVPIEVPGQKMVHLKKGHSIKINKGARNMLVLDTNAQKSASNFVRKTLMQLYGKEQLMSVTAMGRKKDSLSIPQTDLCAIYEFVSEYTKSTLSWNTFLKVVMKKCSALKASPKPNTKKASPRKASPRKASPRKASPRKASPRKASPRKASPRKDTPKKDTPKKAGPKEITAATPTVTASPSKLSRQFVVTAHDDGDNHLQFNGYNSNSGNTWTQNSWNYQQQPQYSQQPYQPAQYQYYSTQQQPPYQYDYPWAGQESTGWQSGIQTSSNHQTST